MTDVASTDSDAQTDLPGVTTPELATMLRPLLLRVSRNMRSARVDSSITLAELAALHTVSKDGPLTTRDLAAREGVRPPSITKVIAKLEELGLLVRQPHATDKRQWLLAVTESGRTLVEAENRSRAAWLSQRLSHNFHVTLMEITGNSRLAQYVDTLRSSVLMHGAMSSEHGRLHARVVDEHLPILAAIRAKDPDAAEEAMASHLQETAQTLITAARRRETSAH